MSDTWRCGHPKTAENTKAASPSTGPRCMACHKERTARWRMENTNKGHKRGRPRGDYFGTKPVPPSESERRAIDRMATASKALLVRMLALGAKSGGCLDISAAQCRARLEALK